MSKFQFHNNQSFILYHNRKSLLCSDSSQSSFTLVELLIVIGILAILTAAVIVVLNPADLLQQSRDSKRLQDLSSLESTINLAESIHPDIDLGTASTVYISIPDTDDDCTNLGLPSLPTGYTYACVSEDDLYNTDGTGWIPINFQDTELAGVITISSLPTDPTNTTSTHHYYTYVTGGSYKLSATLESEKYSTNAADDGGTDYATYEKGTDLELAPFTHGLVAWWKFDGDATDSSGYDNDGTVYGGVTYTTGKQGQAAQFDGSTGAIEMIGTQTKYNPVGGISYSAWIYLESDASTDHKIITGHSLPYVSIYGTSRKIVFKISFSGIGQISTYSEDYPIESGTWAFIVAIYDQDGHVKIYVDGELNKSAGPYQSPSLSSSVNQGIGAWSGTHGYNFPGSIDDVRIYNRALSASEIQAIYNATR